MEGLTKLFRYAFAPESDWGKFSRKVLGILISSTLGASAFGVYYNTYHKPKLGEQPISVVIRGDKDEEARLRQIVSALLSSDRNIRSVCCIAGRMHNRLFLLCRQGIQRTLCQTALSLSLTLTSWDYFFLVNVENSTVEVSTLTHVLSTGLKIRGVYLL